MTSEERAARSAQRADSYRRVALLPTIQITHENESLLMATGAFEPLNGFHSMPRDDGLHVITDTASTSASPLALAHVRTSLNGVAHFDSGKRRRDEDAMEPGDKPSKKARIASGNGQSGSKSTNPATDTTAATNDIAYVVPDQDKHVVAAQDETKRIHEELESNTLRADRRSAENPALRVDRRRDRNRIRSSARELNHLRAAVDRNKGTLTDTHNRDLGRSLNGQQRLARGEQNSRSESEDTEAHPPDLGGQEGTPPDASHGGKSHWFIAITSQLIHRFSGQCILDRKANDVHCRGLEAISSLELHR